MEQPPPTSLVLQADPAAFSGVLKGHGQSQINGTVVRPDGEADLPGERPAETLADGMGGWHRRISAACPQ